MTLYDFLTNIEFAMNTVITIQETHSYFPLATFGAGIDIEPFFDEDGPLYNYAEQDVDCIGATDADNIVIWMR